jgi:DNA-binding transcriptional LysR family regulator
MPKSIADLLQHNCIGMRDAVSGEVFEWELTEGKKTITIKLPGTALVRHTMEALSLALAGVGVVYVLEPLARPCLRDGSLKWLLPQTERSNMTDCFSTILAAARWRQSCAPLLTWQRKPWSRSSEQCPPPMQVTSRRFSFRM